MFTPALAFAQLPEALVQQEGSEGKRLSATASLSSSVGLGTFVADDYSDSPYVAQSVSLAPRYTLTDRVSVGLGWGIGWEYTDPDSQNGRSYSPSDISGTIAHSRLWGSDPLGLTLSGSFKAIAPTSFESRGSNTVTNLTASPTLSKSLGDRWSLSYTFSFTKYLPYRQNKGDDETKYDEDGIPLCYDDNCLGGQNRNFSFRNALGASYKITDKLTGALSLGTAHGWSFAPANGSWTKQRGIDSTSGSIALSYRIDERYSVSGGVYSGQPALDLRGSRPRFPLFDVETPANGFTSFGLTVTGKI